MKPKFVPHPHFKHFSVEVFSPSRNDYVTRANLPDNLTFEGAVKIASSMQASKSRVAMSRDGKPWVTPPALVFQPQ